MKITQSARSWGNDRLPKGEKVEKRKRKQKKGEETELEASPDLKNENIAEAEEAKLHAYFKRLFGNDEDKYEDRLLLISKWVMFGLLLLVELLIVLQHVETLIRQGNWFVFAVLTSAAVILSVAEGIKLFVLPQDKYRTVFYVIEIVASCGFVIVTEGTYPVLLYMLMLTQFYFSASTIRTALWMYVVSLPLFAISYTLQVYFSQGDVIGMEILRKGFGAFTAITLHFLSVEILLIFYRQYIRLNKTLIELDKSKKELEKAYAVVAEVTALEERQRIAKEIHDTAGHSLTTVIMQTEAAKRIIDSNPAEAKVKLVAANLQAKNALERLRESVHLLSGQTENMTLKLDMENIIHESTDGTGIKIRSSIEDITVSEAKHRFLCNTLKEGISNGLRHGNAKAFWLELKIKDGKIHFLLSDNGSGLNTETFESGFGLTTMRERVRSLGGEMFIMSEPGEGFELNIILPMDVQSLRKRLPTQSEEE